MNSDWRDGFPFIGNQLSLDFLNTRPVIDGAPTELLPDCPALVNWLKVSGLLPPKEANRLQRTWSGDPAFSSMLDSLLEFREKLRCAVLQIEAGGAPSRSFLASVNALLLAHPYICEISQTASGLVLAKRFAPENPLGVFAPIVADTAILLTLPDKSRLRKCAACILHFHDTSKKGTRRWCSMATCGNRSKVAAYTMRKRPAQST